MILSCPLEGISLIICSILYTAQAFMSAAMSKTDTYSRHFADREFINIFARSFIAFVLSSSSVRQ